MYFVNFLTKTESKDIKTFLDLEQAIAYVVTESFLHINDIAGVGFDFEDRCGQFKYEVVSENHLFEALYESPVFWEK